MPPKSKKQLNAAKSKIVEDKTFGLKNKNKSKKMQQYVNQVKQQAEDIGRDRKSAKQEEDRKASQAARKKAEEEKKAELAALFAPVIKQQKVPFGVDPKTILCQFFKAGQCTKGTKCKFSHDVDVERKSEKINLYEDAREKEKEADTMDGWDQNKLESVVSSKHTRTNQNNPTAIVCKHFIEAVESRKYGWFWQCPSGDSCKYRHALPPGFVLKKKETDEERREREEREKENELTIEDFLETEVCFFQLLQRHKLGSKLTPITSESFAKWKSDRKKRKEEEEAIEAKKKADAYAKKPGAKTGMSFSGRELFDFNPDWAQAGDDDAVDFYDRQDSDHEEEQQDDVAPQNYNPEEQENFEQEEAGPSGDVIDAELFNEEELEGLDD